MGRILGNRSGWLGGWWRRYVSVVVVRCLAGPSQELRGRVLCVYCVDFVYKDGMGVLCRYRLIDEVIE